MGDLPGHEFHGNQYTAGGGAVGRLQEIAAKHGVRYDEASGKFKVGPIAMSAESAALRAGRAEKEALNDKRRQDWMEKPDDTLDPTVWTNGPPNIALPGLSHPRDVGEGPNLDHLKRENAIPANVAAIEHTLTDEARAKIADRQKGWADTRAKVAARNERDAAAAPKPEKTKGQKAYARKKERESILRDAGLVKVKGARGGTYWE